MKRNLNCAESGDLAELLDMEAAHQVQTGRTEDHREAEGIRREARAELHWPMNGNRHPPPPRAA